MERKPGDRLLAQVRAAGEGTRLRTRHRTRNPGSYLEGRGEPDPRTRRRLTKISMSIKIHWQEGLFLQPHHLQRMQKSIEDDISSERRLSWPYAFGVIEARLS